MQKNEINEERVVKDERMHTLVIEGRNAVLEAFRSGKPIDKVFVLDDCQDGPVRTIVREAKKHDTILNFVGKDRLNQISQTGRHQGVIAYAAAYDYATVEDMIALAKERGEDPFLVLLDNIEDPHNLGAIIRTANLAGAHGVIIPKRRAVGLTATVAKTSAGALNYTPVAKVTNLAKTMEELEVVPAGNARDCGLDGSMILAYGQDDRSCAYAALLALLESSETQLEHTCCCILADKEETGSRGATGMHSRFFENTAADVLEKLEIRQDKEQNGNAVQKRATDWRLRHVLQNSQMLSADVSAAYDPLYENYFEKKNAAYLSEGVVFCKYSGSGGKSGGNDASAEYMAKLRRIMDEAGVVYQTAELGAVDRGGGGTIAYILAEYGMDVIDCGPAVLGMHAPWEVLSKADLFETVKAYRAFYQEA